MGDFDVAEAEVRRPTMGVLSVRLPEEELRELRTIAKRLGLQLSDVVRRAVAWYTEPSRSLSNFGYGNPAAPVDASVHGGSSRTLGSARETALAAG